MNKTFSMHTEIPSRALAGLKFPPSLRDKQPGCFLDRQTPNEGSLFKWETEGKCSFPIHIPSWMELWRNTGIRTGTFLPFTVSKDKWRHQRGPPLFAASMSRKRRGWVAGALFTADEHVKGDSGRLAPRTCWCYARLWGTVRPFLAASHFLLAPRTQRSTPSHPSGGRVLFLIWICPVSFWHLADYVGAFVLWWNMTNVTWHRRLVRYNHNPPERIRILLK